MSCDRHCHNFIGFVPSSMLWGGAVRTIPLTASSIDCLRRSLDVDGTLHKTIACLEDFYATGEIDEVLAEINESGEVSLRLVFPQETVEADVRQRLHCLGMDPDDHVFEISGPHHHRLVGELPEITAINVIFVPPGPPREMEFEDEWACESSAESEPESWLDLPPSESQAIMAHFGDIHGSFKPDPSFVDDENVWEEI